jgi:hypothetical protein
MTEVRYTIPAADLKPGQFFKVNDRWLRAVGAPIQHLGKGPQVKVVSPIDGSHGWTWLYAERVTVIEGNTVPATFRPAALRRKSQAARDKAAELTRMADQLDILTIEMQHEANAVKA